MQLIELRWRDKLFMSGLFLLPLSLLIYLAPEYIRVQEEDRMLIFVLNYMISLGYGIWLFMHRKRIEKGRMMHLYNLFLVLSFISAWALNRAVALFDPSATWFTALLFIAPVNNILFAFTEVLPKWAMHTVSFVTGISSLVFLYLSVYLFPVYIFGMMGFLFFGLSLLVFVPVLLIIHSLRLLAKASVGNPRHWISFTAAGLTGLVGIGVYLYQWKKAKNKIDIINSREHASRTGLPSWINLSQDISTRGVARKMIEGKQRYSIPDGRLSDEILGFGAFESSRAKIHDPLVMIAAAFVGCPDISTSESELIMRSRVDMQHEFQPRLWSGANLVTSQVNTSVKLWTSCNIAYTEKVVTVANTSSKRRGVMGQEEAIYSFYLPEGGVVTSLSLWVNGKEEKGIMTTRERADSAYNAIVGVERRDPSVVKWQVGNTVSVRVFPVFSGEERKFKIGVTSPLERNNGNLYYKNISFKGPAFEGAEENTEFEFVQPAADFEFPASFVSLGKQNYKRKGKYQSKWGMRIKDPGLSSCRFSFDNATYSLEPYHKSLKPVSFNTLYLDINNSWTRQEFDALTHQYDKKVYVYDSGLVLLQSSNKQELWEKLRRRNFSLFPLFKINQPDMSLVVTKSTGHGPSLDDLENTGFITRTKLYLRSKPQLKLFDLGNELNPLFKTLKEFRVFDYDKGSVNDLLSLVDRNLFPEDIENGQQSIIHQSEMIIKKSEGTNEGFGPDHLMRLFSYNYIMQQLGTWMLSDEIVKESLIEEARKSYVVTPLTSLVVLETQADYNRFDIKDDNTSLKNASMHSQGAVPEPHEWALIIISGLLLIYAARSRKLKFR